ncbi:sensor histidine kinase [Actinocorallia longicatena]|uniref:Carrier domain-containing protein n=1 Tax=Actinocorallia longicatena TaxID=111803 RepID=A0ABP6QAL8_9ACTN
MNSVFGYTADGERRIAPRRGRAIGLSFGMGFLIPLVQEIAGYGHAKRIAGLLALALFLGLYYGTALIQDHWNAPITRRGWILYGSLAGLAVLLPVVMGPDWTGLPIYVSIVSALFLPRRFVLPAILATTAVTALLCVLINDDESGSMYIIFATLGLGVMMMAFRHSRELVEQLREARAEVARLAASEERLRIARDLHDLLGHSLSLIVLKSELAARMAVKDPERSLAEVKDVNKVAREALADVRETVSGYRQRSLAEELDSGRAVLGAAGITPAVRTCGTPLPPGRDALFAWVVREAVTNTVRHSGAEHCAITVTDASVEIVDDGRGAPDLRPGNGLTGLRERVAAAGGEVEAGPRAGGGFAVKVSL